MGQPGCLTPLAEGVCSRETVMRMAHNARWKRPGSAGGTPAPRLRGQDARAPSLCSPQPSMRLRRTTPRWKL